MTIPTPRPLPDPVAIVRWYELACTMLVAGVIGGTAGWALARWRRWP